MPCRSIAVKNSNFYAENLTLPGLAVYKIVETNQVAEDEAIHSKTLNYHYYFSHFINYIALRMTARSDQF